MQIGSVDSDPYRVFKTNGWRRIMTPTSVGSLGNLSGHREIPRSLPSGLPVGPRARKEADRAGAIVHIVDVEDDVRRLLSVWLAAAGIESRTYAYLGEFLAT